jgi:hypothetical protein
MDVPLPTVSIVIPCYNYGHYLSDCVDSVLTQRGVAVEAIVVDDASTDGSAEVARRLADRDPRVRTIRHRKNMGHIATYNEGLEAATGDYVVLLSADDMLTPRSLARATGVMEARTSVGLVYGHPRVVYGDLITPARTRVWGTSVWQGSDWISAQCRRGLSCIYNPEVVVRGSVQRAVGGYSDQLPHTADLEMWLRVASIADVAHIRGSDQAYRRMHGASMMQTTYAGLLTDLRGRRDAFEAFFRGAGARLARNRDDWATVRRRLAGESLDHVCSQLRRGGTNSTEAADYVAFAEELVGGDVATLRQWREYRVLCGQAASSPARSSVLLQYSALRRGIEERYRWRRWRLIGI